MVSQDVNRASDGCDYYCGYSHHRQAELLPNSDEMVSDYSSGSHYKAEGFNIIKIVLIFIVVHCWVVYFSFLCIPPMVDFYDVQA